MKDGTFGLLVAWVTIISATCALGQDASPWLGKKVVVAANEAALVDGWHVVDVADIFRVFTVERVKGGRLWLKAGDVKGWINPRSVVPYEQAVPYFSREILKKPGDHLLYIKRAVMWADQGNLDDAIADFGEAIRLAPGDSEGYCGRGCARFIKHENDQAIADFGEAIRLDPRSETAFCDRAAAWLAKHDFKKGLADCNEALRLDPKSFMALNNRAASWAGLRQYDKALADCNEALRLNPENHLTFGIRAEIWTARHAYGKALADFEEKCRLAPKNDSGFNGRAWLHATCPDERYRDGRAAVTSAIRACELSGWKDANNLDTLAAAYAEMGDFEKAVEWEEKAINFFGSDEGKAKGRRRMNLYREKKPYRS